MDILPVDEAIERYVRERKDRSAKEAAARFLSYVHLRYRGRELTEFLEKTTKMIRYYIDFFLVLVNPFKGPDFAFFASAVALAVFGGLMLNEPNERLPGIFLLSGALVNGWSIISRIIRKWCDLSVLIAIYRELLALAEKELKAEITCTAGAWEGTREQVRNAGGELSR
jgi:hypothetical protein